jgi:hypothetical protein
MGSFGSFCCGATREPNSENLSEINMGRQTGWNTVSIILAALGVVAMWFGTGSYVIQEIVVVLCLVAISTVTILIFGVVFLLSREGILRTAFWVRVCFMRIASLNWPLRARVRRWQ